MGYYAVTESEIKNMFPMTSRPNSFYDFDYCCWSAEVGLLMCSVAERFVL